MEEHARTADYFLDELLNDAVTSFSHAQALHETNIAHDVMAPSLLDSLSQEGDGEGEDMWTVINQLVGEFIIPEVDRRKNINQGKYIIHIQLFFSFIHISIHIIFILSYKCIHLFYFILILILISFTQLQLRMIVS